MSINGEITAVHISRKSSLSGLNDRAVGDYDAGTRHDRPSMETKSKRVPRPQSGYNKKDKKGVDTISGQKNILRADSDQLDLEKLMHSVLDIEDFDKRSKKTTNARKQRPFSAHQLSSSRTSQEIDNLSMFDDSRSTFSDSRVGIDLPRRHLATQRLNFLQQNRTNYSFSNDKVSQIDRENQRLLREIMRNQAKRSNLKQPVFAKKQEPVKVKPAAAVNRARFQSQIERENLAFLQRLEKVKPTRELSRDHLLREHFKKEQFSSNISKSKRPVSAGRPKRASSLNDLDCLDNNIINSRDIPGSSQRPRTSKRPISAKVQSKTRVVNNEPVWESGW